MASTRAATAPPDDQLMPAPPRSRGGREPIRHKGAIVGFLAPFAILFSLFYLAPIGYAIYQSFFKISRVGAFGAPEQVFGGLTQYKQVFQSDEFWSSIERVLFFFVVSAG